MRALLTLAALSSVGSLAAAQPVPLGAVVAVGDIRLDVAQRAARSAGGARWSGERVRTVTPEVRAAPEQAVLRLRQIYLEADFLRCLAAAQDPDLDFDALLEGELLDHAALVGVFGAACTLGAGDTELARRIVRRVFVAELNATASIAETTPEFQTLAEEVSVQVAASSRITLTIRSQPAGARVQIDGRMSCAATRCRFVVRPGTHFIKAERLGHLQRMISTSFEREGDLVVALDPAPATELRAQLAGVLASERVPDRAELAALAAQALGAQVVVFVWPQAGRTAAAAYDRARGRFVARALADGPDATRVAVQSVVREWRGVAEPTPLVAQPLFWVATVGVAATVGATVFLLTRPEEKRYDLVVP